MGFFVSSFQFRNTIIDFNKIGRSSFLAAIWLSTATYCLLEPQMTGTKNSETEQTRSTVLVGFQKCLSITTYVKQSRNRPGVARRVPGSLGSHISMTFSTLRLWDCQSHAPAAFPSRKFSWYSFSLGTDSTPGPCYGRKEYVTEKSSDTTGNRSRDRPTGSAAP